MRLQWIFMFLLVSCWIAPTEETMGSWDLSSLLSTLVHGDHDIETVLERSLSRSKRSTGPTEYTVDIEISFPDPSFASQIKQFIATNLTLPIVLGNNDTNITSVSVTTACNQTGSNVQCSCESGYMWPGAMCTSYNPCLGSNASNCNCIQGTSIPAQYCQPKPVAINLSLKILQDFTADLYDPTSTNYKQLATKLKIELTNAYGSLSGFQSATVTGFRPGSVVADYTVVTEPASTAVISTANGNLLANLKSANISVAPTIKSIKTGNNIIVTPSNIFNKDRVVLTCTVNISSYVSVSWTLNSTQAIQNTSYTIVSSGGTIKSTLTLTSVSQSNAGIYACIIEDNVDSYQSATTIVVQPLGITVLNTNVACNNTPIPIMQCCTQGPSMDFVMTCSVTAGIPGIVTNNTTCAIYQVTANQATCAIAKTGTYVCNCYTQYGANETGNVKAIYQATYVATVTSKVDNISEGKDLSLQCSCNATSVQSIAWYFQNTIVPSQYYPTTDPSATSSTLTIPGTVLTVAWSGTYQCSVNTGVTGIVSASKAITVVGLVRSSQISLSPVALGFKCGDSIPFSCCISDTTGYKGASLAIPKLGTSLPAVTTTSTCFTFTYKPTTTQCVDFTAQCIITNQIDDTVTSGSMTLTFVADPKCTDPYIGEIGAVVTVQCQISDPKLTGTQTFTCEKNGNWNLTDSSCVSAALNNIQNQLAILTSPTSQAQVPSVLADLTSTVTTDKQSVTSSANNIQLVVTLLQQVQTALVTVEVPVMQNFLQTVNVIVDNSTTWNQINSTNKVQASSNLLQSVEKFAEKLTITGPISITNNSNIQLSGNIISNLTNSYNADFNFSQTNNLTGNVFINKTILDRLSPNATVVSIAYATLKDILNTNTSSESSGNASINGLVMTTTVSDIYPDFQIEMEFKKSNLTLNKTACVYWNFTLEDWDSTGCQPKVNNDSTMVTCACNHLTSFSILMSVDTYVDPRDELILTYISYIGLGISLLSLVICIIIEATVWKSVTKNKTSYMRHVCIMNIAVTLLMADTWFIIGGAMSDSKQVEACVAATFFTHVFYLCTFFWMLTMGLILFYRLMCVFHDLSKSVMMGISFFLGYGCPIIIGVITVAVTQPRSTYTTGTSCWLNVKESKAFLAFILPALTILLVNFMTLFVVIIKVLRPTVGDRPKKEEKSSLNHIAKCILILTPLLGLTWGFGIGTLISTSTVIRGIFSALNALQGLFILLFGCLLDKKVRDALLSRFSVSRWSSQQTKTSNISTAEPVFSKGVINLFAKKGVYNISSAQAGSSSEMSNSYSLLS